MKIIEPTHGAALQCDRAGFVSKILHNQIGLVEAEVIGHSLPQIVGASSMSKALSFLVELRNAGTAFDWEMELPVSGEIVLVHLMGVVLEEHLLIMLAKTDLGVHVLFDEIMQINREQLNRLRSATKDRIDHERLPVVSEDKRFDDLTRLNNEMAVLQRDLARKNMELERLNKEVSALAVTDQLTGILNRRGFFDLSKRELDRSQRFERDLAAIMLDIDHFKRFNDDHGHATGDEVLQEMAARCTAQLRKIDIFGRYGGEEFAVILPETDLEEATAVAERLRNAIGSEPFETAKGPMNVSISLGVAMAKPETGVTEELLGYADKALYLAKQLGRNRVCTEEEVHQLAVI